MRPDCVTVEETISDCAREGREVPGRVLEHARKCKTCGQALRDAEASALALASAREYPPAPDCRSAVAARIARSPAKPQQLRWAWAFGAAALIVSACLLPILTHEPGTPDRQASTSQVAPPTRQTPEPTEPSTAPSVERQTPPMQTQPPAWQPAPNKRPAPQTPAPRRKPVFRQRVVPRVPAPAPNPEHIAKAPPAEPDRPMAVVLVLWDDSQQSNSYEYSRTDTDTGVITTCKVTESDGVVEVDMQSSPQPNSGGNTDETVPGV